MKKIWIALLLAIALLLTACNIDQTIDSTKDGTTLPFEHPSDCEDPTTNGDVCPGPDEDDTSTGGNEEDTSTSGNEENTSTDEGGEDNTTEADPNADKHKDEDNNGYCDVCKQYVVVTVDFYSINDLHGKLEDGDSHPGVDELTTYLKARMSIDEYTVFLSAGDMWQGGSASNGTKGKIMTDWMNHIGFEAMALGNHEFDWGEDAIKANAAIAEFPILAINVYDNATGQRVEYCESSVMIQRGGAKIGIIGAIGDCYSSISSEMTKGVNFKTGSQLTALVKAESEKLRAEGADIIVYVIHDGTTYSSLQASEYYDSSLSSGGYVDMVFGGHTHSYYVFTDSYGVPHLQGGGDNSLGMTHVEVDVNYANGEINYNVTGYVRHSEYESLSPDPIVQSLITKYWDEIGWIYNDLGYNSTTRKSSFISSLAAKLYYEAGVERWGDKYDIVLAGGSINTRSPYEIPAGNVQYSDLQMILPFDNPLYLCSIKGSDLLSKFMNNSSYAKYSTISISQVDRNKTYYIICDSWTALYEWAKCTPIELYDENIFARDLIAQYIREGGLE